MGQIKCALASGQSVVRVQVFEVTVIGQWQLSMKNAMQAMTDASKHLIKMLLYMSPKNFNSAGFAQIWYYISRKGNGISWLAGRNLKPNFPFLRVCIYVDKFNFWIVVGKVLKFTYLQVKILWETPNICKLSRRVLLKNVVTM